jgi:hypothetical protein
MTSKPASRFRAADKYAHIKPLPDPPKAPDAMQQRPSIVSAHSILDDFFNSQPNVLVNGDGYLCVEYRQGYPRLVPDCIVAFGVDPGAIDARNGYVIGEVGKPPEFVLEVASSSTGRRDVIVKREIYASFGVAEYWRFDRSGGAYHGAPLGGDLLVDGVYQPVELNTNAGGVTWGRSPVLGLDLCWYEGRLRIYDPVAQGYLPELSEAKAQARSEAVARTEAEDRAASAEDRAASAEDRAASAEAEIRRLREELCRRPPE